MIRHANRTSPMRRATLCLTAGLVLLAVAGCGRKGPLERPGTPEAADEALLPATVFGTSPASPPPAEPPKPEDKPFFLDFLI
jgi:predicted small lipoprotein YifL